MLNISLREQVQAFVEQQAIAAGFGSANEYIYHLGYIYYQPDA
jgi:antitoxin ParD1/3/4